MRSDIRKRSEEILCETLQDLTNTNVNMTAEQIIEIIRDTEYRMLIFGVPLEEQKKRSMLEEAGKNFDDAGA